MTPDMGHLTCDNWDVGEWIYFKNFSPLALTIWDFWYLKDLEEMDRWLNHLISDKAVCKTAPTTPGLLKSDNH